jgi:hypothetical protein
MTETPGQSPTAPQEDHPIQPTRWHGVAPARLVWLTAGLVITAAILLVPFASSFRTERLITSAQSGASTAFERLEAIGESGKLSTQSDRLGAILASRLESEWKPRIKAHAYEHPADELADRSFPESLQPTGLPPGELTQRWERLFFLSNPKRNASQETWSRIGQASLHFHIKPEVSYNAGHGLSVTIVIYNALDGLNDPQDGLTLGFMVDEVRINGERATTPIEAAHGSPLRFVSADWAGFPSSHRHGMRQSFFAWQEDWIPTNEAVMRSVEVDARVEFLDGDREVQAWAETIHQQMRVIPH